MSLDYIKLINAASQATDVAATVARVIRAILDNIEGTVGVKAATQGAIDDARTHCDVLVEAIMMNPNAEDSVSAESGKAVRDNGNDLFVSEGSTAPTKKL